MDAQVFAVGRAFEHGASGRAARGSSSRAGVGAGRRACHGPRWAAQATRVDRGRRCGPNARAWYPGEPVTPRSREAGRAATGGCRTRAMGTTCMRSRGDLAAELRQVWSRALGGGARRAAQRRRGWSAASTLKLRSSKSRSTWAKRGGQRRLVGQLAVGDQQQAAGGLQDPRGGGDEGGAEVGGGGAALHGTAGWSAPRRRAAGPRPSRVTSAQWKRGAGVGDVHPRGLERAGVRLVEVEPRRWRARRRAPARASQPQPAPRSATRPGSRPRQERGEPGRSLRRARRARTCRAR